MSKKRTAQQKANIVEARVRNFHARVEECRREAKGDVHKFADMVADLTPYIDHSQCDHENDSIGRRHCRTMWFIKAGATWADQS